MSIFSSKSSKNKGTGNNDTTAKVRKNSFGKHFADDTNGINKNQRRNEEDVNFEEQVPSQINELDQNIKISAEKKQAVVTFHNLELNVNNPESPRIRVVVEKHPIKMVEGKSYGLGGASVFFDKETDFMRNLAEKTRRATLNLPERKRPAKVLEIFRRYVHYAYDNKIKELYKTKPSLAKWVEENTGPNTNHVLYVPLSQIFEKGYGVCRHLSVAYLWLAQKVGLKGVILSNSGHIINIRRRDTGKKLFQLVDVGQPAPPHVWVEIKTSDGKWIPVDPSTNLVGDNEVGLAMFRDANYIAAGDWAFGAEVKPRDKLYLKHITPLEFRPAESKGLTVACLELESMLTARVFPERSIPPTKTHYSGVGTLIIRPDRSPDMNLDIIEVKPEKKSTN